MNKVNAGLLSHIGRAQRELLYWLLVTRQTWSPCRTGKIQYAMCRSFKISLVHCSWHHIRTIDPLALHDAGITSCSAAILLWT